MSTKSGRREGGSMMEEVAFVTFVVVGALLFALGVSFLVLAVSVTTNPPSPYLEAFQDRIILIGASIASIIIGVALVRMGARIVGW